MSPYQLFVIMGLVLSYFNSWGQSPIGEIPAPSKTNLREDMVVRGYFDSDSLLDALVVYGDTKELRLGSFLDTCIPHTSVMYLAQPDGSFTPFHETQTIFPCPIFTGRSDNYYDTLYLNRQEIVWRTCQAPRFDNTYRVVTFTLRYSEKLKAFTLVDYLEHFYESPEDDNGTINHLAEDQLPDAGRVAFSIDDWPEMIPKARKKQKSVPRK